MSTVPRLTPVVALLMACSLLPLRAAEGKPYHNGRFQGRIAYSADDNHNDPDDWIASPVTLAILAEAGLRDRLLSFGSYGTPAAAKEFTPYFWMRDSRDAKVRWLWERMLVSTRPDPSDAGMTWFLGSGDEECDPSKLKSLLEDHRPLTPVAARQRVRLEAENFRHLEGFVLEDRNDRQASHRLNVRLHDGNAGRIRTRFEEPYVAAGTKCDLETRYFDEPGHRCRFAVSGYSQELWAGYRRYADPTIEGAVSSLMDSKTDELELPSVVGESFAVELVEGSHLLEWFEVARGESATGGAIRMSGEAQEFRAPFEAAAVLSITRK